MALALMLHGCGTFGTPAPDSPKEAIAQATITLTNVLHTYNNLRDVGIITPSMEAELKPNIEEAIGALDAAKFMLASGRITEATSKVEVANQLLLILRQRLAREQGQ
jgi:hypothetical protein